MSLAGFIFGIGILATYIIYLILRNKDADRYTKKQKELNETIIFPHPQKVYTRSNRFFIIGTTIVAIISITISTWPMDKIVEVIQWIKK